MSAPRLGSNEEGRPAVKKFKQSKLTFGSIKADRSTPSTSGRYDRDTFNLCMLDLDDSDKEDTRIPPGPSEEIEYVVCV